MSPTGEFHRKRSDELGVPIEHFVHEIAPKDPSTDDGIDAETQRIIRKEHLYVEDARLAPAYHRIYRAPAITIFLHRPFEVRLRLLEKRDGPRGDELSRLIRQRDFDDDLRFLTLRRICWVDPVYYDIIVNLNDLDEKDSLERVVNLIDEHVSPEVLHRAS